MVGVPVSGDLVSSASVLGVSAADESTSRVPRNVTEAKVNAKRAKEAKDAKDKNHRDYTD